MFDGVSAYRLELQVLGVVAFAAIGVPIVSIIWRYGHGVDASSTDITKGDWRAFRKWRKFIGTSRKRLAQSINVIYPRGYTRSEDTRNLIEKSLPVAELVKLLETANGQGEALTEGELDGTNRFQELTKGKWFDITKSNWGMGQPD